MSERKIKDLSASVHRRLLNKAREEPFNELLLPSQTYIRSSNRHQMTFIVSYKYKEIVILRGVNSMTRTTVILDDELLSAAKRITGEKKTSRVLNKALEDMVRRAKIKRLLALKDSDLIELSNEEIEELDQP